MPYLSTPNPGNSWMSGSGCSDAHRMLSSGLHRMAEPTPAIIDAGTHDRSISPAQAIQVPHGGISFTSMNPSHSGGTGRIEPRLTPRQRGCELPPVLRDHWRLVHPEALHHQTAAFSRSQPVDSQYRWTLSRFCCKVWLGVPFLSSLAFGCRELLD